MISTSAQNDALQGCADDAGRSFFEVKMERKPLITWWEETKHCTNMILRETSGQCVRRRYCPLHVKEMMVVDD
ncbi:hypothetical protein TSUD_249430 [Trifolium subterraneum]|nr:hypothetical protein TSUD_249430 [Trifolium subterraneum]